MKRNKIGKIYACDGNVGFTSPIIKHVMTYQDYYIWGLTPRLSHSQTSFNNLVHKKRKPKGFYWIKK